MCQARRYIRARNRCAFGRRDHATMREVDDGEPSSSTARMMCAVPATRGITITRGPVPS